MSSSPSEMISLMVVDDHPSFVGNLRSRIETENDFQLTHVVDSVFEAVELVRREPPDVVLMNIHLADGDGLEAAKYLIRCAYETSVLMMAERATNEVLTHVLEEGCAGLITRDVPLEVVIAALRDAASGNLVFKFREIPAYVSFLQNFVDAGSAGLTSREREVLECLLRGESTSAISEELFISTSTVRNHVNSILTKMGAHSKLEAVTMAQRERLIT